MRLAPGLLAIKDILGGHLVGNLTDIQTSSQSSAQPNDKASAKKIYEVEIAGLPLKIKAQQDEKTVRYLVEFVDKRISQALKSTKSGSIQSAAVLACLNVAEELIMLKQKAHLELERLETKAKKSLADLESSQELSQDLKVTLDH